MSEIAQPKIESRQPRLHGRAAKVFLMMALATAGGELSTTAAQARPEAAPAAAKRPKPPEAFPVNRLKLSAEQIKNHRQSDVVLGIKTETADTRTTVYRCNAYKVSYKGDSNLLLTARHCAEADIIEQSSQPAADHSRPASNYQNAVPGTGITAISPADFSEIGSSAAIVASNQDDLMLIQINPEPGWEKIPAINLDNSKPKAAIGARAYIYGSTYLKAGKNSKWTPEGADAVNLGPVHDQGLDNPKALYEAYGISGADAKKSCVASDSGEMAVTADGHHTGGLWISYATEARYLISGNDYLITSALRSELERHNGISLKGVGRVCLFTPMRYSADGKNLSMDQLIAGESNLIAGSPTVTAP